jgi:hypothetical protein
MNSFFNLDGYKIWNKRTILPNENANYVAYQNNDKTGRCILFNSGADMVNCLEENFKNGVWDINDSGAANLTVNPDRPNTWTFGDYFPTLNQSREVLESGSTSYKMMNLIEKVRADIFTRMPIVRELNELAPVKRRRRKFTEDGDELDIDRYMCGDPAAFVSLPRQDVKKKSARVYIDLSISGYTDTEAITKNIIFAAVMCDIIEKAGINMEIIFGDTTNNATCDFDGILNISCIGKSSEEPMDIARVLSFALPAFERHYIFGITHYVSDCGARSGMGQPVRNTNIDFYKLFNADIIFRGEDPYWNPDGANVWVQGIKNLFNLD